MSETDWQELEAAAEFHDIGKMGQADGFWDTPGQFAEWQNVCKETHPGLVFPLSEMYAVPWNVAGLAVGHHLLSKGYPSNGLIKVFSPFLQKPMFIQQLEILSTVDVVHGMYGKRSYRPKWTFEQVMGRIIPELGSIGLKFIPAVQAIHDSGRLGQIEANCN